MALNYVSGDINPRYCAVDSAQTIAQGDIVWLNTDDVRSASQKTYTSLAQTQEDIVDVFMGVCLDRSQSGETALVQVATTGVFRFSCAAATFEVGDLVGCDDNAGGTALTPQQVIAVTDASRAIGHVAKRVASAATSVEVEIRSSIMYGGPQKGEASA